MAKKIVAIQYGNIHYHAGCNGGCDFTDAIGNGRTAATVRKAVLRHVRETGHECWIESGKITHYTLESGRTLHAPDAAKSAAEIE